MINPYCTKCRGSMSAKGLEYSVTTDKIYFPLKEITRTRKLKEKHCLRFCRRVSCCLALTFGRDNTGTNPKLLVPIYVASSYCKTVIGCNAIHPLTLLLANNKMLPSSYCPLTSLYFLITELLADRRTDRQTPKTGN